MPAKRTILLIATLLAAACSGGKGGPPTPRGRATITPGPGAPATSVDPAGGQGGPLTPPPAPVRTPGPGDQPPTVAMRPDRPPDSGGWYARGVRVSAEASDDIALAEVCFFDVPNRPSGSSSSSQTFPCPRPPGRRWSDSLELGEEARHIVQLWARDDAGQQTNLPNLDLLVDLTPPASGFSAPAGVYRSEVRLDGSTSDASSGAALVTLTFTRPGERLEFRAACECPSGFRRNRPPSGWSFAGTLPPGRWTVTASAVDHAGHPEASPPSVEIEVV